MVKPEKFDNLHLVYHFIVPLKQQIDDCDSKIKTSGMYL